MTSLNNDNVLWSTRRSRHVASVWIGLETRPSSSCAWRRRLCEVWRRWKREWWADQPAHRTWGHQLTEREDINSQNVRMWGHQLTEREDTSSQNMRTSAHRMWGHQLTEREQCAAEYQAKCSADVTCQSEQRVRLLSLDVRVLELRKEHLHRHTHTHTHTRTHARRPLMSANVTTLIYTSSLSHLSVPPFPWPTRRGDCITLY